MFREDGVGSNVYSVSNAQEHPKGWLLFQNIQLVKTFSSIL